MTMQISGIAAPPRFTRFELAYLLAGRSDQSAKTSREVFGLAEAAAGDAVSQAGASSLVARGLIEEKADEILPRNEAGLVGFALGTATQWISVVVRTAKGVDVVVFFQGKGVGFMGRGAPADTIDFVPIQPQLSASVVAREAISALLSEGDADIMIREATMTERKSLYVSVRPEGLGVGTDPVFPGDDEWPAPDLVVVPSDAARIESLLIEMLNTEQSPPQSDSNE